MYGKLTPEIIGELKEIAGEKNVLENREAMEDYAHDEVALSERIMHYPDVVVKPGSTEEVSKIVRLAKKNRIPITPRGAGTGLSGGCVPTHGGIVLSLERMNRIIEIDEENFTVTVEAGARLMDIFEAVEAKGLFFPPHPGDISAMVGGTIATNAGGARAVKYGVMRNFVRGVEVVLPDGEIMELGGKIVKDCSGYSLLNLFIGSEGTLGIITKGTLRLMAPPSSSIMLIVPYNSIHDAIKSVPAILKTGVLPITLEFIEESVIGPTEELTGKKWPFMKSEAYLMIIVDSTSEEEVMNIGMKLTEVCMENGAIDAFVVDTPSRQEELLEFRGMFYEALKDNMVEILDISVPPSRIAEYVDGTKKLSKEYGISLPTYGHAGDGNVHTHIMKDEGWMEKYEELRYKIHELGVSLGGTITGEHGVGLTKKDYLMKFEPEKVELMRSIKKAMDPDNIMNPGKIVDV